MNYDDFITALDEIYMDISEVAEHLGLTEEEIKSWEESDEPVPEEAVEFIKSEKEKRSADQIETEE